MRKCTKLWTTREGRRLRICDMKSSHLANTIAMLRRNHSAEIEAACSFESQLSGEMALDAMAGEIRQLMDVESDHPLFEDLLNEVERRR